MHVVSENTPAQIAANEASEEIRAILLQLTANILRTCRGAGRPEELPSQANAFVNAVIEYKKAAGIFPQPYIYAAAISIVPDEPFVDQLQGENLEEYYAERAILRGSLQIVASRLLGQLTVRRTGEREQREGVEKLEKLREARRALYQVKTTPHPRKKIEF